MKGIARLTTRCARGLLAAAIGTCVSLAASDGHAAGLYFSERGVRPLARQTLCARSSAASRSGASSSSSASSSATTDGCACSRLGSRSVWAWAVAAASCRFSVSWFRVSFWFVSAACFAR